MWLTDVAWRKFSEVDSNQDLHSLQLDALALENSLLKRSHGDIMMQLNGEIFTWDAPLVALARLGPMFLDVVSVKSPIEKSQFSYVLVCVFRPVLASFKAVCSFVAVLLLALGILEQMFLLGLSDPYCFDPIN